EYVPFGFSWIPGLQKLVGPIGRFEAGDRPAVLPVRAGERNLLAGPLICYEDIFPQLALGTVRAGADFLFVCTNNAWFGEEGCTKQHAAHSVLRAVELRRPVIRCGNHGWSGWIDEYGNVPPIADELDPGRSRNPLPLHVFFKDTWSITRDSAWADQLTFYARYGDWFIYLCIALMLPLALFLKKLPQDQVLGTAGKGQ
ncbi:MAG: nitrilase-related carbon-nitrogen hydrolase, partial [Opitutales bacterium]